MAIRPVVYMEALPGKVEAMKAAMAHSYPEVRVQPGVLEFGLYQDIERPGRFVSVERYADATALANHGNLVVVQGLDPDTVRRITKTERYEE
jgi:quinol monooxygenase YgiN